MEFRAVVKRVAVKLGLVLLSCVFVCAALEIVLAIAKINTPSNVVFDPAKGITHIPGARYRHTKEGFSEGRFNSAGLRDVERTEAKPPGTYRIEVLGDSYVEALEVGLGKTFPALLEKKLGGACAPQNVEVLNLGQSGFGTTEELMRYESFGARYAPDMVILAFYVGNDFRNNSRLLNGESTGYYYTLDPATGELRLDRSLVDAYIEGRTLPKRAFQWLKERSYLASLISERLYLLERAGQERRRKAASTEAEAAGTPASSPGAAPAAASGPGGTPAKLGPLADENIYLPSPPPEWQRAFAITRGVLGKLKETVGARGAALVIVVIGSPEQVLTEKRDALRQRTGDAADVDRPARLVEDWARELGVPCLPLAPAFVAERARSGSYLHFGGTGGGHWNEAGHELAATTVASFLRENRLLPPACAPR